MDVTKKVGSNTGVFVAPPTRRARMRRPPTPPPTPNRVENSGPQKSEQTGQNAEPK
jgi:hypothetical protein